MSTLQERLDRIKQGFMEQLPDEVIAVMNNATESLRESGIMDRIPSTGALLPAYSLPDTEGNLVDSDNLLKKGPMVLAFYRGVW